MSVKFKGTMPALVTPLTEDEKINTEALRGLMEHLISQGADGFYIGGATGEGLAIPREQREILAAESVRIAGGRVPCIVHIAAADFKQAKELAKQAEACGADAISAIPPIFFQYDSNDVYNYYKELANAVHIPMMIYYNPAAGFAFDAKTVTKMFGIDNVTSIKWTNSDYYSMIRLKDMTNGEMNIMNGKDEMLLMGLNAGADGGIGTTYNFIYPLIKGVYDSFIKGDIAAAQAFQSKADKISEKVCSHTLIPATKAIVEAMGYNVGNAVFPMKKYSAEEKKIIVDEAKAAGLEI